MPEAGNPEPLIIQNAGALDDELAISKYEPEPGTRRLALLCGRYEGIDERVRQHLVSDEISIGDYVLTGGELAALIVIDAVTRLIPGALGDPEGAQHDSHASGLLEYPHYTRPPSTVAGVCPMCSFPVIMPASHAGGASSPFYAPGSAVPICSLPLR